MYLILFGFLMVLVLKRNNLVSIFSNCVDIWYDIKYAYCSGIPRGSIPYGSIPRGGIPHGNPVRAEVLNDENFVIYKWSNGLYYITGDTVPPFLPAEGETADYDISGDGEAILFFDNVHARADEAQLKLITLTAGPGEDYTISKQPSIEQLRKLLDCPKLTKVIFNNSLSQEFIIS
jgi:hypothetical protein